MSAVDAQRGKPIVRSDRLQAATANDAVTVVVGSHGVVLVSDDDARSWKRLVLDGRPPLIDTAACPDGTLLALGFDQSLWTSTDDAATWSRHTLPTQESPVAVTCDPDGRYWVIGSFSLLLSSEDHARSWNDSSSGEDHILTSLHFLDASNAVLTAEFGGIYRSRDGGSSWTPAEPIPDEFYPQASLFADNTRGWVAGLRGTILHTRDGGLTWTRESTDTQAPLYTLQAIGERVVATGDHGTVIVRGTDGHWQRSAAAPVTTAFLADALPLADGTLLVVGGHGTLARVDLDARQAPSAP